MIKTKKVREVATPEALKAVIKFFRELRIPLHPNSLNRIALEAELDINGELDINSMQAIKKKYKLAILLTQYGRLVWKLRGAIKGISGIKYRYSVFPDKEIDDIVNDLKNVEIKAKEYCTAGRARLKAEM